MNELVWIDCEMTGLDLKSDALIEVACLVTDRNLNVLGEGVDVIIRPTDEQIAGMSDFVLNMHESSGLIDELASGTTMDEANKIVLDYIREYVPEAKKAPLAGNTIGTDRAFLARDLPEIESYVSYRNVDVSTIKELAKRWFKAAYYNAPEKSGTHRALSDIRESIEELRYFRKTVFVASPGPRPAKAKHFAQQCEGSLRQN